MNVEQLKVIISAETDKFKKGMSDAKKEMSGLKKEGGTLKTAFSAIGTGIKTAFKTVGVAVAAVSAAIITLSRSTEEMRKEQAKLNTAFLAAGSSAEQASKTYGELYRFLGDGSKATEAAGHLAQLTTEEQALAEYTTALQGVYATFGDSLPIESLTEAMNETAKVGKVTGTFADALNWAGISEDAFNASLAATNSEAEREALIRNTLNATYSEAALLYEKNNQEILQQNEAQNRLNQTLAQMGKAVTPAVTALTNLGASILEALAPAINAVMPYITAFINGITKAVNWVLALINALTGSNKAVKETQSIGKAVGAVSNGAKAASDGAKNIGSSLGTAAKEAEKLKRVTAGFDELNMLSSGSAASGGGGSGAGGGGVDTGGAGGIAIGGGGVDLGLTDSLDKTADKAGEFANKIKKAFEGIKNKVGEYLTLFEPTKEAWGSAFDTISSSWNNAKVNFAAGGESIKNTLATFGTYLLEEFIPPVTNSLSTNLLPMLSDIAGFSLEEAGKAFEHFGGVIESATTDIITPALENFKGIITDTLDTIGKEWDEHGESILGGLSEAFEGIRETWDTFYAEVVKPIADEINKFVEEVWNEHLKPLWDKLVDAVASISSDLLIFWNKVLKPIIDWVLQKIYPVIKQVLDNVLSVCRTVIGAVSGIIGGVITVIKGVVQFIVGVFTGDWKKAWEGIKNIVTGIFDGIWAAIKGVINLIIDGINSLWGGIYQAVKGIVDTIGDIAGVIGNLLGQDWSFSMPSKPPKIPKLATGGIVIGETLARIGEGGKKEAVLPLEQNTGWMDALADRIASRNNTPSKIVLMLDGKELGWANINSINSITKQTGNLPLVLV